MVPNLLCNLPMRMISALCLGLMVCTPMMAWAAPPEPAASSKALERVTTVRKAIDTKASSKWVHPYLRKVVQQALDVTDQVVDQLGGLKAAKVTERSFLGDSSTAAFANGTELTALVDAQTGKGRTSVTHVQTLENGTRRMSLTAGDRQDSYANAQTIGFAVQQPGRSPLVF